MVSLFFILFLAVIILAVAGIIIYFFAYKSHINRALLDDDRPQKRIPTPNNAAAISIMIICAVFFAAMMVQMSSIYNTLNNLNAQISSLRSELHTVADEDADEARRRADSLVLSAECEYGAFDEKTHTAQITLTVVPKAAPTDAVLSVRIGGETVPLTQTSAGVFSGVFTADVLQDYEGAIATLILKSGDAVQTEALEDVSLCDLRDYYYPTLYVDVFDVSDRYSGGKLRLTGECGVSWYAASCDETYRYRDVQLVTKINGEEIKREPLLSAGEDAAGVSFTLRETYRMQESDHLAISVLATDTLGRTEEHSVYQWQNHNIGVTRY